MAAKFETKIAAGALLTLLVVGMVCVLSYQSVRQASATSQMVAQTYQVLTQLHAALGDLTEAEAGTRGFLLSGEDRYVQRQEKNFSDSRAALQQVAVLTRRNALQQARIASLQKKFEDKIAFLGETTQLRQAGNEEAARERFETGQGRQMMDDVRQIAGAMEETERALLHERRRQATRSAAQTTKFVLAASVLNALLLAVAFMAIRREMRGRRQLEGKLRHDAEQLTAVVQTQNQIIATELDLQRVVRIVIDGAQKLTGAAGASIEMLEGEHLVPWTAIGPDASAHDTERPALARLAADCVERHEVIISDDLGEPPAPADPTALPAQSPEAQARSAIFVPLRSAARVFGVLKVFSPEPRAFSATDANALELIAGFIAAAMSNARAYGARQHLIQELTAVNEEIEAFSYSVSHDLRAPLRHISGFGDLLRQHLGDRVDEKARRYLTVIGESSRNMGVLIDELLAFARVGRAELQRSRLDLAALIQTVIQNLHGSADGRDVQWQIGPLPEVEADAGMMRQVFTNLIDNALKYTRSRPRAVIEIGSTRQNGEWLFHVRDNGAGFDPRYAKKLFGVFQRLHRPEEFEGTGIGLANVRRVIQKHGGRTWAEAELDAGATFYFTLPLETNLPT